MKSLISIYLLLLLAFINIPKQTQAIPALPERNLTKPSQWYWLTGVTAAQIKQKVDQGYRIFDLEIESTSPYKFSVAMIKNSGAHKSGWWWYYGKSSQQIKDLLSQKKARIIDMEIYYVGGQKKYGVVMVPNTGSNAKSWWYYSALTGDQVGKKLSENKARMVDFDTYVQGGKRYFTAVMIANKGNDAKGWWYYSNLTAAQVKQKLSANKARITDIEVRQVQNGQPRFMVVMEKLQGEYWWWYYGKTMNQVNELANQNGARIIDITPYKVAGKKRFAVAMLTNVNDQTNRIRKYLSASQKGGSYGGYVKRIGGAEEVYLQPDKAFYPASTIKVLEHVYAMRQVQMGKAKLTDKVIKYEDGGQSCSDSHRGHKATQVSLQTILKTMMENSDNQSTNAVQEHFGGGNAATGRSKINAMAKLVLKLSNQTKINHKFGCGGPSNNPANSLTIRDVAKIYEKVAGGVLKGSHKTKFYELMLVGKGSIEKVAEQEGKKLGLSSSVIASFKGKIKSAAKAGSFTTGSGKKYSNIGGWVSLPTKSGQYREYVYGYFRDGASSITEGKGAWDASAEMLREQIRAAMKTYKTGPVRTR